MKQQWPEDDVMVRLLAMYQEHPDSGSIVYWYHIDGGSKVEAEAAAKATMELMETRVALAVDVVNGMIFLAAPVLDYAMQNDMEPMFRSMPFRELFDLLKQGGLPARVIQIKKNGSIKYLD